MTRGRATAIGLVAVLLWALLALLTVRTAPVPPFQLNAICFAIGGLAGLVWSGATGGLSRLREVPPAAYLLGIGGLFGYHAFYFTALRLAPPAEASLIAYLWPLLIVLMSGLLPGERLRPGHLIGALIAFAGAAIIVLRSARRVRRRRGARLRLRRPLRAHMVHLLGPLAPLRRCADRRGDGLLPRHGGALGRPAPHARGNGMARGRGRLGRHDPPRASAPWGSPSTSGTSG